MCLVILVVSSYLFAFTLWKMWGSELRILSGMLISPVEPLMTRQHPGSSGPVPSGPVSPGQIKSVCLAHSELHQTGEQTCPHARPGAWLSLCVLTWGADGHLGGEAEWALGPGSVGHCPLFIFPRPGQYVPELGATSEDARLGLGVSPGKGGRAAAGWTCTQGAEPPQEPPDPSLSPSLPLVKLAIRVGLAVAGSLLGAFLTFPGLRLAQTHHDALTMSEDRPMLQLRGGPAG